MSAYDEGKAKSRPGPIVHLAGLDVMLGHRYLRQRCAWCGALLVDYDLTRCAVPEGQHGGPSTWRPGALIRVDGSVSSLVDDGLPGDRIQGTFPDDACCADEVFLGSIGL